MESLGLAEMGHEVTNDVEMIVCRCQQLAKLEGEKIVDKVTSARVKQIYHDTEFVIT